MHGNILTYLAQMTKAWAVENAKFNITSNSISPSFMLSGLTKETDDRIIEQLIAARSKKRLLTVEEVVEVVDDLLNSSETISGTDILLD